MSKLSEIIRGDKQEWTTQRYYQYLTQGTGRRQATQKRQKNKMMSNTKPR